MPGASVTDRGSAMTTQPAFSDEETLKAFRRYTHDLWEAVMTSPVDSELPRLRDYSITRPRSRDPRESRVRPAGVSS
jgi:hypothetical protein